MSSCAESLFFQPRNSSLTNFKFIERKLWPPNEENYLRSYIANGWQSPKPKSLSLSTEATMSKQKEAHLLLLYWHRVMAQRPCSSHPAHQLASFIPTKWTIVLYLKEVGGRINIKQDGLWWPEVYVDSIKLFHIRNLIKNKWCSVEGQEKSPPSGLVENWMNEIKLLSQQELLIDHRHHSVSWFCLHSDCRFVFFFSTTAFSTSWFLLSCSFCLLPALLSHIQIPWRSRSDWVS